MANDKFYLTKELTRIKATPVQRRMAFILFSVNGLENAMGFVSKITVRGQLRLFNDRVRRGMK